MFGPAGIGHMMGPTKPVLDLERVRRVFDLSGSYLLATGGDYRDDPYPTWHQLRAQAPVHTGKVHELSGITDDLFFHGLPEPDRPHFSAFSWDACQAIYRDDATFASSAVAVDIKGGEAGVENSMLSMGGTEHRRYRGLVQSSFGPARSRWWIENWIEATVNALIDCFLERGSAELNVEFCAAIPVLTITSSFGVPVEKALDIREALSRPDEILRILAPIVAARREEPQDDLISVLVQSELSDEEGRTQRLSDAEILSFSLLLLAAGSGTTWKQMGITLAALLRRPALLQAVKDDRNLLKVAIEEAVRWAPTDPMFSRWVTEDLDFFGVQVPKGSVMHICVAAANRDPQRWDHPDEFDLDRPIRPHLAFGSGPHVCIGQHVARAEMSVAIGALLDRLPDLRLDPDAEPPALVGYYERGATAIPVLFG